MYHPHDIATYIIRTAETKGRPVTNPSLQGLLYLMQKEHIEQTNRPLFDAPIIAFPNGPVVRSVWDQYSYRGGSGLHKAISEYRSWNSSAPIPVKELDDDTRTFVDSMLDRYLCANLFEIASAVHEPGTPFTKTEPFEEVILYDRRQTKVDRLVRRLTTLAREMSTHADELAEYASAASRDASDQSSATYMRVAADNIEKDQEKIVALKQQLKNLLDAN